MLVAKRDPNVLVEIDTLSRANRELVEDTFRVMSITFSYLDGPKTVDEFVKHRKPRPYSYLLYARLGDLYMEKERWTDAADSYRAFVSQDRNNEKAPLLEMQAIEAYSKGGFPQLVLQGKKEFVENYSFGTAYWQGRDPNSEPKVVAVLKTNLKDVAQYYHAQAQRTKDVADYQEAAKWYRSYLRSWPDDPGSAVTNYLLADTLFESKQYLDAAQEYESTAYHYGDHDKAAAAGYAAIIAYGKQEETLIGRGQGDAASQDARQFIEICADLSRAPGKRSGSDAGGHRAICRERLSAGDFGSGSAAGEAAAGGRRQTAHRLDGDRQFQFRSGRVRQGRSGLYACAGPDAGERSGARRDRRAACRIDLQAGRTEEQIRRQRGRRRRFLARVRLGAHLEGAGECRLRCRGAARHQKQWDRAIAVLEGFRRNFPESPLQEDVTRNLAVAYSESNRPGQAAVEFELICASPKETPEVQREATLQAAELYDKAGNTAKSSAMLEAFVKHFPSPLNPAMEARNKLSVIAAKSGDLSGRDYWLRDIIAADRAAGAARTDRSRALAAKATLTLAAPVREEFKSIKLVAPLKKSLAEKRKAMEAALKAYEAAADYQVADVTTAATFESAELYRQLGKDLMSSERPKNLNKDELEQYDVLLEEQAFPFEEKAIKLHEVNAARTKDGTYDEWVQKSFAALAQLNPGRYGKVEIGEQLVESIR